MDLTLQFYCRSICPESFERVPFNVCQMSVRLCRLKVNVKIISNGVKLSILYMFYIFLDRILDSMIQSWERLSLDLAPKGSTTLTKPFYGGGFSRPPDSCNVVVVFCCCFFCCFYLIYAVQIMKNRFSFVCLM